ncbi:MAG: hypothetical protein AAF988_00390 [Pseudomonadota bacterium]
MGLLSNGWVRAVVFLGVACVNAACDPIPGETPRDADRRVSSTVAGAGSVACSFVEDSRARRACFAAAAAAASAAGSQARTQAANAGSCIETRRGRVDANNPVFENCRRQQPW